MSGASESATAPVGLPGSELEARRVALGPERRPLALRPVPPLDGIPAKRCPAGHANDLEAMQCRLCGQAIGVATPIVDVPPEPLARILLEDGTAVDLDTDLLIGRSPSAENGTETLTVAGRQVSRRHLLIEVRGWRLRVRDVESTNGTFLSRQGERGRRRIPDGVTAPVHLGDTIHFGSRQALIVAYAP